MKLSEKEFYKIVAFIKSNYGIDLGKKRHLIEGRLSNLIEEWGYDSFDAYFADTANRNSMEERNILLDRLTTNHTFFMRETEHFELFVKEVLPWLEQTVRDRDLRIWSAGCSTGEEPYTLAMHIQDYFGPDGAAWDKQLLATDLSSEVLKKAEQGIYAAEAVEGLYKAWRFQYFDHIGPGRYQVKEKIRKEVLFRRFNLMDDFPFRRKFHTIFCRNVMIYFDQETKNRLVRKFYDSLEDGGYLFIGMSESLAKGDIPYEYVMPSVYRKGQSGCTTR